MRTLSSITFCRFYCLMLQFSLSLSLLLLPSFLYPLFLSVPSFSLFPPTLLYLSSPLSSLQILTTHAMEEADHLCTRIGIMNFGRLRCLGTQNRLKSKFGTGYQLAFNCAPGRVGDVESFVSNNLRKAVHIETYAGVSIM